jgi:hypothetical protein
MLIQRLMLALNISADADTEANASSDYLLRAGDAAEKGSEKATSTPSPRGVVEIELGCRDGGGWCMDGDGRTGCGVRGKRLLED